MVLVGSSSEGGAGSVGGDGVPRVGLPSLWDTEGARQDWPVAPSSSSRSSSREKRKKREKGRPKGRPN